MIRKEMTREPFNPALYSSVPRPGVSIHEMTQEVWDTREKYGRGSSQALAAFSRLVAGYKARGDRIDSLRRYEPDEKERFFRNVVNGLDGHAYWMKKSLDFKQNDGVQRKVHVWWWLHIGRDKLPPAATLLRSCKDEKCISPYHRVMDIGGRKRLYSDNQLIGLLQVQQMKTGIVPTGPEWAEAELSPSVTTFINRFGSWTNSLRAAGLKPRTLKTTPERCIEAIQLAKMILGHWPTTKDFRGPGKVRDALIREGLPRSTPPIYTHLGPWEEALQKAGKT